MRCNPGHTNFDDGNGRKETIGEEIFDANMPFPCRMIGRTPKIASEQRKGLQRCEACHSGHATSGDSDIVRNSESVLSGEIPLRPLFMARLDAGIQS